MWRDSSFTLDCHMYQLVNGTEVALSLRHRLSLFTEAMIREDSGLFSDV